MNFFLTLPLFLPVLSGIMASLIAIFLPDDRIIQPKHADPQLHYRIMFYNTENFYDTRNDSLTADDEFTPAGAMHWTLSRYNAKLNNLYKTFVAIGGWQPPDIIGVCEVENKYVLSDLVNHTPLVKYPYRIIHSNSPDKRGIDIAALYNTKTISLIRSSYLRVNKPGLFTRDILYFMAIINRDTCYFFMNHWPSRSKGQLKTERDRFSAALRLSGAIDSLFKTKANAKIVIMGDFNDEPDDESLVSVLKAKTDLSDPKPGYLYNLSHVPEADKFRGTIKFRGQWNLFDQVIVSGSLLKSRHGIYIMPGAYHVFGEPFLLTTDDKFNGYQPFRTYNGYKYSGGFSDHLPVFVDLNIR